MYIADDTEIVKETKKYINEAKRELKFSQKEFETNPARLIKKTFPFIIYKGQHHL